MKKLNKRGQGMTEYIVILGIIVSIALAIMLTKLKPALSSKVDEIVTSIGSAQ